MMDNFLNEFQSKPDLIDCRIRFKRLVSPIHLDSIDKLEFAQTSNELDATIIWYDGIFRSYKYNEIDPSKYMNKIPGMNEVCCKNNLFYNLRNKFQNDNSFFPLTFLIPEQLNEFRKVQNDNKGNWILKPKSGYGGRGIKVLPNSKGCSDAIENGDFVIQRYISPNLDIENHKFDFRIYLLITNLRPLTLYIYQEGIARFCSKTYDPKNIEDNYSNLTNVSINSKNPNIDSFRFIREMSEVLKDINKKNEKKGGNVLWKRIKELSAKTIFALYEDIIQKVTDACRQNDENYFKKNYNIQSNNSINMFNRFFHLLGLDVIIDSNYNPYILELNDNPAIKAFNNDEFERKLKTKLISDEISLFCNKYDQKQNKWEKIDLQNVYNKIRDSADFLNAGEHKNMFKNE